MQVLIEIKERDTHFQGIVTFPNFLNNEVEEILGPERKNIDWIVKESAYKGYLDVSASFPSVRKASKWTNKISDQICLVKSMIDDI